ncbi:DUF6528 family protein [Sphingobacterium chuzhouense]|uniref:WD40-like Beta Propeller Repeat n=1 Tax=Sphingobacterium chuzhouense TaxID=1742264 RepID=A0ABR7XTZ9_9SPHI|nr:DUF6528 family protein [Sphingobacterium chuzhouense]MBD1422209.1 hypothetical protein [Sphingobacterium chuzhouense]
MKKNLLLLFFLSCLCQVHGQVLSVVPSGALIACGEDKVLIIDPNKGNDTTAIIWSWSVHEAKAYLPERYQKLLVPFDECKPIDDNTKILLTSSGGATCILDIESRKIEFYAHTPMAHSADIIPGGFIAVANSTHPHGNSLEIYHRSKPEELILKDTLYSGHGVVWHPQKERLFVLGFNDIRCYKIKQGNDGIDLQLDYTDTLPDDGGHDLSQVDLYRFLITTHQHVFIYDIDKREFTPFDKLDLPHVKSINYSPHSDHLVYTKAEESWWTFNIYLRNPDKTVHLPFLKLYKVRVVAF